MAEQPHVEFGMYDFASVRWAWDDVWAAVHERVPWTPQELTRSGDVHARWRDPECVVTHVCGWPFAALHRSDMHLVGSFVIDVPEAEPPAHYRSVLLTPHDRTLDDLVGAGVHAVANSADSLSGWHSLRAATVGPGNAWPGTVTFTGAHHDSLRALAVGDADLACIDSWSLAFIAEEEPDLVRDLHRVAVGPRIPTPAITARRSLGEGLARELGQAFQGALDDPATEASRRALHITGFAASTLDDYLATLPLGPDA
jgi:ABC-type phosphate/phosphonate transport system substrate-binding protein